ncbi:MAG TPA: AraC family transcriptional regulator [Puia sp.]|nr:AraC family transcriptional regulator [Puia sp.]
MKLFIKNMVSLRCKLVVGDELKKLGFETLAVDLGQVEIKETPSAGQLDQIRLALEKLGFELLRDKKDILVQRIKNIIVELVYYPSEPLILNLSVYLSNKLDHDYTYLSNLFSEQSGVTIEKFYIYHKIERVKELLSDGKLTLTEIAFELQYSSVAHLSNQFKKVTGLTPSQFKQGKHNTRSPLENL